MSFRVNTNIMAMNALRNLGRTNDQFSGSVSRLSTGLRINSAADDPAGLIISETFRAQIGGIEQAVRNNQDAINFVKTGEGALEEVSKLLNDARALAVASANSATLTDEQKQANQNQLNSIVSSVSRIAAQTSYGTKKLLDGSAGTYAGSISGANVQNISFTGVFSNTAITTSSTITVSMTTAAQRAQIASSMRTFAFPTTTMGANAGTFAVNGVSFNTTSTDTIQDVVARINNASTQTGVVAAWTAGGIVTLTSKNYGADARVDLIDTSGVLRTGAGSASSVGVNAVADVALDMNGSVAGGLTTVSFASGNGLILRDLNGNSLTLTEAGNLAGAPGAWGQLNVGSSIFQVGANAGQTTSVSLKNFAANNLGANVVSNKDFSNLDLTSQQGATDAMKVIDKAISDIASARGDLGSFQRNILDSNVRSLSIARENLSATESAIRDVDIAEEMTTYAKLQILQQSGLAVLAQANSAPQAVLSLLRG